jgi:hypothetical protein
VLYASFSNSSRAYVKAQIPHHTHHHHHTEKVADVKIVEVPVIKEVKVLQPYKVPYKVHVPYFIHQEIHKIPVHKHPVHTSEHIHHEAKKVEVKVEDEGKHSFGHSESRFKPIYVSHSPIAESSYNSPMVVHHHMMATERTYKPEITSLNTKVDVDRMGFGSQEGQMTEEDPWEQLDKPDKPEKPKRKERAPSVPYPFPQEQIDILSGKHRLEFDAAYHPSSFDFVSFH